MDLNLVDKRVVVTGGASNIGRAIVHEFVREGARVLLCDIDGAQAQKVQVETSDLAGTVVIEQVDLTVPEAGRVVAARCLELWGGVDILVNCAGWSVPGYFLEQTDREFWQRTVDINLFAAIACTQAVLPHMQDAGEGAVVFLSSEAAFGAIRQAIYGATKAGLISLARSVARESGRKGVRANVVCPGLVVPEPGSIGQGSLWAADQNAIFDDAQVESVVKATPLRRLTTASDIANTVVWLSSERVSRQVTGQVVAVAGGSVMP